MITTHAFEHPAVLPLVERLQPLGKQSAFDLALKSQADVEWELLESLTDAAIISPIGFAESTLDVQLLDGACVAAFGATDTLNLYFKPGLRNLTTVACIDVSKSETVLTGVVLREKYNMTPTLVPVQSTIEQALNAADGVLVCTPRSAFPAENVLDIVDEWWDMTQLPYVQFLVAGWKNRLTAEFADAVETAGKDADEAEVERVRVSLQGALSDDAVHQIPGHYRYRFDEEVLLGLNEYYRFAFFHGLHKDIPDVVFWQPDTPGAADTAAEPAW